MKYVKLFCVVLFVALLLIACNKECTHQYQSQITLQATCTEEGVETFTCANCQHSYTEPIPILGHSYGPEEIERTATCAEEGIKSAHCTHCGATVNTPIEKKTHMLGTLTVSKEPNCTQEGLGYGDCIVCGAKQIAKTIPTNGVHVFVNTVIQEATCTEMGEGINTCQLCQYSEPCQYEIKDHTYSTPNVLVQVSCTKNGEVEHVCDDCGYSYKETVTAPGHNWSGATCQTAGVCSSCGAIGSKAAHNYVILEDRKASGTFASYRIKKCSTCELQKSEYYTASYVYDLNAIAAELAAYARQKGFTPAIEVFTDYDRKVAYGVWELELPGCGPNQLLKGAKLTIDAIYSELTGNGADLGNRTMHIYVYYTQNGALGAGFFGVYLKTTYHD